MQLKIEIKQMKIIIQIQEKTKNLKGLKIEQKKNIKQNMKILIEKEEKVDENESSNNKELQVASKM